MPRAAGGRGRLQEQTGVSQVRVYRETDHRHDTSTGRAIHAYRYFVVYTRNRNRIYRNRPETDAGDRDLCFHQRRHAESGNTDTGEKYSRHHRLDYRRKQICGGKRKQRI